VPVITFFGLGNWSTSDGINKYILKPGKQTVTLRLYPQKIEDTLFKKSLTKDTKLKITITKNERHSDPMWAWQSTGQTDWNILTFETPKYRR
jgi:hypothetical protein